MNRSLVASLMIGAALTVGALTAPTAQAEKIPEATIKSECKDVGGTYVSQVKGGIRFSACRYKDLSGKTFTDFYADGEYYSTTPPA